MSSYTDIIIYGVQTRPYIFNKKFGQYKSQEEKNNGFKEIADSINDFNLSSNANLPLVNGNQVQSEWNRLFNDFKLAYKQVKASKSGDGASRTTFPYFKEMSFLIPHLEQRPVLSSLHNNNLTYEGPSTSKSVTPSFYRKRPLQAPAPDNHGKKKYKKTTDIDKINHNFLQILENFNKDLNTNDMSSSASVNQNHDSTAAPAAAVNTSASISSSTLVNQVYKNTAAATVNSSASINSIDTVNLSDSVPSGFNYTNLLMEIFKGVPPGEEIDCLNFVLDDFHAFEESINN
uniref:MADF domain-containing protein n=1 Tax=Trichogramma kaykai TaxID=54128 RepID=A0ABD2WZB9_9HYME